MKTHKTLRKIDGEQLWYQDIGCDDFDRAEHNRYMIKNKTFTTSYVQAEEAIQKTPLTQALASWIPQGKLPQVSKEDWRQFGGEQGGGFEIIEPEVVRT